MQLAKDRRHAIGSPGSSDQTCISVVQPDDCSVHNIFIVDKFPSFREFLQFLKQIEITEWGQVWLIRWLMEQFENGISDSIVCSACDDV